MSQMFLMCQLTYVLIYLILIAKKAKILGVCAWYEDFSNS